MKLDQAAEQSFLGNPTTLKAMATVVGLAVFLIDAFTPLDIAIAVLYVVVVLLVASVASRPVTIAVAWACVAATVLGFMLSHNAQDPGSSIARCGVSLIAILTVSFLALRNQTSTATLRKQVELLNLTHDAVVVYDMDDRITFWNQGAERLYGWTSEQAIGQPIHGLTQTDAAMPVDDIRRETLTRGNWQGELKRVKKSGETVVVSSRWTLSRDKWGKPLAILATNNDITDAKRMEGELLRQKNELRATIDAIPGMVWSSSNDGRLIYLNRRWNEYGVKLADDGHDIWQEIVHAEDFAALQAAWREALATSSGFEVTARIRRGDGVFRWMHIGAAPLRDSEGNLVRWYGVNTDIEERKRAEQALDRSRSELAHVTRVTTLGEMAASIAHEVTQPLAAIVTAGDAALRWLNRQPPNVHEAVQSISQMTSDAKRATDIIRQIRSMAQKRDPQPALVDLNMIVRESVELVRRELQSQRVELSAAFAEPAPVVCGDRVQLQQVVINLLMNGVQAMSGVSGRKRVMRVATRLADERHAQLSVEDSGIGISEKDAGSLFNPFFTTKKDGMGMGLSICRSIVEAHGGRIWAESQEGQGASMQFVLPLEEETCSEPRN
ncbi:PAS domain-containing sensor histidine kinase [Caballeronia sp. GAWG1-1]|uniref:PAS domain-containing sensor histidine kinase n=1 Tax=Caballeronia sp. GAWG1-1 TaxID=2921742 RepID=UPI0020288D5B|nr:PAS domain-containing sensor histidine kinase [Caballeronia sp. GAWG1-1]